MKVAILGATSHIAKGLISNFMKKESYDLFLYARNTQKISAFMDSLGFSDFKSIYEFDKFGKEDFDTVINCVGNGTPKGVEAAGKSYIFTAEKFDNMAIEKIGLRSGRRYINFSSGAVYGKYFSEPVNQDSVNQIKVNFLGDDDFYSIAKLNSEMKHRILSHLPIIDIRVFSYFSRYIDLNSGFLMSDIVKCIINKEVLQTSAMDIERDYSISEELFRLVECCLISQELNTALDVKTIKPVSKSEILSCFKDKYGLKYSYSDTFPTINPTGCKSAYYSMYSSADSVGFKPKLSSIEGLIKETAEILNSI